MTGNEILQLAAEFYASSKPKSEALSRAIIGRSYYAGYHLALSLLADLGLPRTTSSLHAGSPNLVCHKPLEPDVSWTIFIKHAGAPIMS